MLRGDFKMVSVYDCIYFKLKYLGHLKNQFEWSEWVSLAIENRIEAQWSILRYTRIAPEKAFI